MKAAGTFAPEDLVSAAWVHLRPRKSLALVGLLLLALVVGMTMFIFLTGSAHEVGWAAWAMPGFTLYGALVFGVGIPYKCRRSYAQRKDLQRPCTFAAGEGGFEFSTEGITGTKKWSDYLKWKEGEKCFMLYMSDNVYQVIPKRFLQSEDDARAFREIFERKIARRVT
jgi:hypothetical protein